MGQQFRNMAELVEYFNKGIKSNDEKVVEQLERSIPNEEDLEAAANSLKEFLEAKIQAYYNSYSPVVYKRTNGLLNSVRAEMVSSNQARVYFDSGLVAGRDGTYNKAMLIGQGWVVDSGRHQDIYRWGFFEGVRFIEEAIAEAQNDEEFANIEIIYQITY